jgi:hypothetical protein
MVTSVLVNVSRKYAMTQTMERAKLCEVGRRGEADMWGRQEDRVM